MKGIKATKKKKLWKVIIDNETDAIFIITILISILTAIFLPYYLGKIMCYYSLLIHNFTLKYMGADCCAYWVVGMFAILLVLFISILGKGIYKKLQKIRTCAKYCYIPLTEEELEFNHINTILDYINLIYECTVYLKKYCIDMDEDDVKILINQSERYLNNNAFKENKKEWMKNMTEIFQKIKNIHDYGFWSWMRNITQTNIELNEQAEDVLYQGYHKNTGGELYYIIVTKNKLFMLQKSIAITPQYTSLSELKEDYNMDLSDVIK